MKKLLFSLLLFFLVSAGSFAQSAVRQGASANESIVKSVYFQIAENELFYTGKENKKFKIDTVSSRQIATVIAKELQQEQLLPKNLQAVIEGDDSMSSNTFTLLLNALLAQKLGAVRIKASLF